ncbi:MAG TPA: hypothetical protein DCS07_18335 [Bdellovibrionales bacterium]|nr:MAG: hypothetical protein A2Z97_05785 [Bdellovibrionales bacterium GWB1_52_6]OFZ04385.1 MAG: hypothetical protein A2X97_07000 [Bdellovibrionales bacterium GWA1_52_35]OFZ38582.1 MAG: hypothetical protein A2070_09960 [Bdellovibrionales bacterium GWC1_52_8]HAR44562.1 hypothetical protein [Bdellovibrionales bacterium]HCM40759.1 hypothetical protein [Bdellovibrionales bacterium]
MTVPITSARSLLPPSPPKNNEGWSGNALTVPRTPSHRVIPVDRSKVDPQTLKVAQGMEAMFLDIMMKAMRQTVPENGMDLENVGTRVYQGMLDSEYVEKAARAGGIGLSDQIIAYLESHRYNSNRGYVDPAARQGMVKPSDPTGNARLTGGTHEGQLDKQ